MLRLSWLLWLWVFSFVLLEGLFSRDVCLSLLWLSEGSELGRCVIAILKTCSAAPVVEGHPLGSGWGKSCVCPLGITLLSS